MLIAAAVFLVLFAGIWAAYWFFVVRPEQRGARTVRRRLRPNRTPKPTAQAGLIADTHAMSAIAALDALLNRRKSWTKRLLVLIQQSGVQITVGTLLLGSAFVALLAFAVTRRLTGLTLVAIAAGAVAAFIPAKILKFVHARRMRQFETQFPEALDLMARALRAGHAFATGIEMVGAEMPAPVGPEFRLLFDRQNYGMAMPDALHSFADRVPVLDARFFVTAVLIQRESGGNLSEVLDNLSTVIRDRQRVKRQMRVLSAHGRITGWVLVALAPVLGFVLMSGNPEHRAALFENPIGIRMIAAAAALQIIGTYIISKIVNVEY